MLTKVLIKNFTLIDKVEIDFLSGFTTVTGDTGSGKSILLSALSLIIGKRAGQNLLKNSTLKCVLEAEFNLSNFNIQSLLQPAQCTTAAEEHAIASQNYSILQ